MQVCGNGLELSYTQLRQRIVSLILNVYLYRLINSVLTGITFLFKRIRRFTYILIITLMLLVLIFSNSLPFWLGHRIAEPGCSIISFAKQNWYFKLFFGH